MFQKKYSPTVHGKASMFAFHLMQSGIHFVLQEEMVRLLHMTIDETRWDKQNPYGGDIPHHKSEFSASVLCRFGKVIEVEVEIVLMKRCDGEWLVTSGIDTYRLKFPSCRDLKGAYVYFNAEPDETGKILRYCVWFVNESSKEGSSPEDEAMCEIREKLLAV